MQIHELNTFVGTPSETDYLAIDDGTETNKVPATALGVSTQMTQAEAEAGTVTDPRVISPSVFKSSIIDIFYPVGSYYETSDADFDPNTAWGGTWVLEDGGRVHISSGTNIANTTSYWGSYPAGTNTFSIGERGGEPTHTLTVQQMPSHRHRVSSGWNKDGTTDRITYGAVSGSYQDSGDGGAMFLENTGGGGAHNNIPPYTVINRWHRTA